MLVLVAAIIAIIAIIALDVDVAIVATDVAIAIANGGIERILAVVHLVFSFYRIGWILVILLLLQ